MTETLPGYPGLTVERNVVLELADGVRLASDIYRPSLKHKLPVLLTRLPYDKTEAGANLGYAHPAWYAMQGYIVVAQDVRGRWASGGEFYPFLHEAKDGVETIRWAAGLPGFQRAGGHVRIFLCRRHPAHGRRIRHAGT